ncbi:MAG: 4'-phosphopantetheinyl transferase superfamily protein [Burkholderiaceae bacterium]
MVNLEGQPSPAMLSWLSAAERAKASRFVFGRDRRRYEAAHTMLRQLLAPRTGVAPQDLQFFEGPFGKPAPCPPCECVFNLSHSEDDAAVLIAAQGEIGVDIEALRSMPDAQDLAQRNFSAEECSALGDIDPALSDQAFLTGWTRKEACLKAIGSGLSIAPRTFTAGIAHDALRTRIATPQGIADVAVQSFCHEQRLLVAWARVLDVRPA